VRASDNASQCQEFVSLLPKIPVLARGRVAISRELWNLPDMESRMLAVVMTEHGGPDVLRPVRTQVPEPRTPHDALIRVHAAGVNPADWQALRRSLASYATEQLSSGLILGMEGAGVVEAVGRAVTRFGVGDEVYYLDGGFGLRQGNYAQYKVVDARYLARKPVSLSFSSAGAVPVALITAWEALYDRAQVRVGDCVLIHGDVGGVGHIAIQLAYLHGARVAATVSTHDKAALARLLGAERTIRYRAEDVAAAVREWTGREGVEVVFDIAGGTNFAASLDLVAPYGTLVTCVVSPWPPGDNRLAEFKNARIAFENIDLPQVSADHTARLRQTQILEDAARLFDEGNLRVAVDRSYPLADALEAHRALELGEITGRVVLDIP
jgi:NADPH2:quinone reductase